MAEVSSRHISFLETGRSRPSREMISRLAEAMSLPLATRNQMLNNAGFTARYTSRHWDDAEMAVIRTAVDYTLAQHSPYPAIALDRLWNVVRMNVTAEKLFGLIGISQGSNLLDLVTSPLPEKVIENWPECAHHSAQRLRTESAAQGGVEELERAADILAAVPYQDEPETMPVIPTVYKVGDMRLSLMSTIAQFGTPTDVTLDDLKIELFFPTDEATKLALETLA